MCVNGMKEVKVPKFLGSIEDRINELTAWTDKEVDMKSLSDIGLNLDTRILKVNYRAAVVLEVVLVIAVLIAIAILFSSEVREFAVEMFSTVFGSSPAMSIVG